MTEVTTNIPARLKNAAVGGHVAGVEDIVDDVSGKTQAEINTDVDSTLSTHQNVINGLNSQNYESVTATSQTIAVTDVLPVVGKVNTVYRVGNWNGSQFDASVYSEYTWNGSQYVHLSTKPQIGEVFDISAYRATGGTLAKYADLAAALDGGDNIPQSLRKGGMSVKFVQSSDNKYVQYILPKSEWSSVSSDWEKIAYDVKTQVHIQETSTDYHRSFVLSRTLSANDNAIIYLKAVNISEGTHTVYAYPSFQKVGYIKATGDWEKFAFKCTGDTTHIFITDLEIGNSVLFQETNIDKNIRELYNNVDSITQSYVPTAVEMSNIEEYRKMVFHITEPFNEPKQQIDFQLYENEYETRITSMEAKVRVIDLGGDNYINTVSLAYTDLPNYKVEKYIIPETGIITLHLDLSEQELPYGDNSLIRFRFYIGNNTFTQFHTTWNFEIDIIELSVNGQVLPLRDIYKYDTGSGTQTGCTRTDQFVSKKYDGTLLHKMYFAGLNNSLKGGYKEIKIIGSNNLSNTTFAAKNGGTLIINNTIIASIPLYWLNQKYHDTIELNHSTGLYEHHKRCGFVNISGPFYWIQNSAAGSWYTREVNSNTYKGIRITLADNYCRAYPNDTLPGLSFAWDGNLILMPSTAQNWSSSNDVNSYIASNPINALVPIDEEVTVLSNEAQILLSYLATKSVIENCSDNIDVMYIADENEEDFFESYKAVLPNGLHKQSAASQVIELGGTISGGVYDNGMIESPNVIYDDDKFLMVYTGYKEEGGTMLFGSPILAESYNLTDWTKTKVLLQPNTSILSPYKGSITGPVLRKKNGIYYLYFIGCDKPGYEQGDKSLCLAVSKDMNTWYDVIGAPVLETVGINRSTWYCGMAVYHADFIIHKGKYYCFINANGDGYSLDGNKERIGYALGDNPIEFTFDETPVITSHDVTTYDNVICGDPCLFDIGDENIYMYYFSAKTGYNRTGECMAYTLKEDFPNNWKKYDGNPFIIQSKSSVIYIGGKQYHFLGWGDGIFLYINKI